MEHVDVLIVGAGLSGIGAAHHLQERLPHKTYAIFEARDAIGGTWDLFRYPGVRSDSDMYTLGYRFRPWTDTKALADGPSILDYVRDTAREAGIDGRVRFGHRVTQASWSDARWTVATEGRPDITCDFLYVCGGYYRYDQGYLPEFAGVDSFEGRIVHPQFWPEDLDCAGKRVVVVGSGATAVTLVPALAETAAHVTMLQRSPSYILSIPSIDPIANGLRRLLGARATYPIARWKNVALSTLVYQASQRWPKFMRGLLRRGVIRSLPAGYDVDTHFKPRYGPWDQRLCLVPDGDLFKAISAGRASMVTDRIERFTPSGIRLESGAELEADIIVTATGLEHARARRHRADRRRRARLAAGAARLQGHDAQRRAEPRVHDRLHERVLDAEGRPRRGVRLPPAGPHGPARLPPRGARRRRPDASSAGR